MEVDQLLKIIKRYRKNKSIFYDSVFQFWVDRHGSKVAQNISTTDSTRFFVVPVSDDSTIAEMHQKMIEDFNLIKDNNGSELAGELMKCEDLMYIKQGAISKIELMDDKTLESVAGHSTYNLDLRNKYADIKNTKGYVQLAISEVMSLSSDISAMKRSKKVSEEEDRFVFKDYDFIEVGRSLAGAGKGFLMLDKVRLVFDEFLKDDSIEFHELSALEKHIHGNYNDLLRRYNEGYEKIKVTVNHQVYDLYFEKGDGGSLSIFLFAGSMRIYFV